jgi:hypothetical protein
MTRPNPEHLSSEDPIRRGRQQARRVEADRSYKTRSRRVAAAGAVGVAAAGLASGAVESGAKTVYDTVMNPRPIDVEMSGHGIEPIDQKQIDKTLSEGGSITLDHPTEENTEVRISMPEDQS